MDTQGIVLEIQGLETSLQNKLRSIRGGDDEEETKQDSLVQKMLAELRQSLLVIVDRVMATVAERLNSTIDATLHIAGEVDLLCQDLRSKKAFWTEKSTSTLKEKVELFNELGLLNSKIEELKPRRQTRPDISSLMRYNSDQIYQAILGAVDLEEQDEFCESNGLLMYNQGICNFKTGKHVVYKPEFKVPECYSCLFINSRIYLPGGKLKQAETVTYLSSFFSCDSLGKCAQLERMSEGRSSVSISGLPSQFICVGGWNQEGCIRKAEQYFVRQDKWIALPPLNHARHWPASCVLESRRAFCFCGAVSVKIFHNSIEMIDIGKQGQWKLLPLDERVAASYDLAAAVIENKIYVFGGRENTSYNMYAFNEEGELVQDFSDLVDIPGMMAHLSVTVHQGRIYSVGTRQDWNWERRIQQFDGFKWSLV